MRFCFSWQIEASFPLPSTLCPVQPCKAREPENFSHILPPKACVGQRIFLRLGVLDRRDSAVNEAGVASVPTVWQGDRPGIGTVRPCAKGRVNWGEYRDSLEPRLLCPLNRMSDTCSPELTRNEMRQVMVAPRTFIDVLDSGAPS